MATYYVRADGTAANKAAATGPSTNPALCMSMATHNSSVFSPGDIILISGKGGAYSVRLATPSSGASGNPIIRRGLLDGVVLGGDATYSGNHNTKNYITNEYLSFENRHVYVFNSIGVVFNYCVIKNSVDSYGLFITGTSSGTQVNNCVVHGNAWGVRMDNAGSSLRLRNTAIYGNRNIGLYVTNGALDYDYNLIIGNAVTIDGSALSNNISVPGGSVDGGHNITAAAPRVRSHKNNNTYFLMMCDDSDTTYWKDIISALPPGVKFSFNVTVAGLSAQKKADLQYLQGLGHEIVNHGYSHTYMANTTAFNVTTTNANPTCNVDVAGQQIVLATTTPGNTVTLAWAGDKSIAELKAAVAGKGWTITNTTGVQNALLLSSMADSAGAQSVPYTANLDRSANGKFFENEIKYGIDVLEAIPLTRPTAFSWPGGQYDAQGMAYCKDYSGILGARGATAGDANLASLSIYNVACFDMATLKGDGTEATIRKLANFVFTWGQNTGRIIGFLAHTAAEMTVQQWGWYTDELLKLGAQFITFSKMIRSIKADHTTTDGITYSKTYVDLSDYRLTMQSPCINAGEAVAGVTTDYFGDPVPFGTLPDIGLYEFQEYPALSSAMRTQLGGLSEVFGG